MTKQQIIEAIRERNGSADREFLSDFDDWTLSQYLTRLQRLTGKRGAGSRWIRSADTTAIVCREVCGN